MTQQIANLQHILNENLDVRIKQFVKGEHIIIEDLEYVKDTHKDMYDTLNVQGIKSLVVSPIFESSEVSAFFGLDNPCNDLNDISNFLGITASFITYLLRSRNYVRSLKYLSFYDQLTALKNRHAFKNFLEELKPGEKIAIVYCDVTGLKVLNYT